MEKFKKVLMSIAAVPISIVLFVLFLVICIVAGVIAAPFALVYGLVAFIVEGIDYVWKGDTYAN